MAPGLLERAPDDHCRYLGVVCLLLRTRRSISPYYHLNITDRSVPLTTIVETTHVVDSRTSVATCSTSPSTSTLAIEDQARPLEEIHADYLRYAKTIFPDLSDEDVLDAVVQRARVTEPVHLLGGAKRIPDMFPAPGLALASTAHVYPEIVSGQAVIGVADRVVPPLFDRLTAEGRLAA